MKWARPALCAVLSVGWVSLSQAATWQVLVVGLKDDPRYEKLRLEKAYAGQVAGRPLDGALVAAEEAQASLQPLGHQIKVQSLEWNGQQLPQLLAQIKAHAAQFVLLDLPAAHQKAVMAQTDATRPASYFFNVSEASDELRGAACHPAWLHTLPSARMHADALSQWLMARNWKEVLMLSGSKPADLQAKAVWQGSLKRFGLKLRADKGFVLSGDPRQREAGNVRLLTADPGHDVVLVVDAEGEFARGVPYNTAQARPVVGDAGLLPMAWHARWDRYGAPQLNRRFQRRAGRPMGAQDWAAWAAVKSVASALEELPKAAAPQLWQALRNGTVTLDGFKGVVLSYRAWDGQLRQPVFLAHTDAVAGMAPLEGAMHPRDVLDTLGADEGESACRRK